MEIRIMVLTTILSSYVWTLSTDLEDEIVDPFDMLNYDSPTQSMRMILKQRRIYNFLKDQFKRILENAETLGLPGNDEEIHFDAEVFFTKQALNEIFKLLKDEEWDPAILERHIQIIPLNFKKYDEQNWKFKFEDMDIYVPMVSILLFILCGIVELMLNCFEDFIPENKGLPCVIEDYRCEGEEGGLEVGQDQIDEDIRNAEQYPVHQRLGDNNRSYGQKSLSTNDKSLSSNLAEVEIVTPELATNPTPPVSLSHAELQVGTASGAVEIPHYILQGSLEPGIEPSSVSFCLIDDIYTDFSLGNENSSEI